MSSQDPWQFILENISKKFRRYDALLETINALNAISYAYGNNISPYLLHCYNSK